MKESKSELKLNVFVCTNQKVNKECCAAKGGEELRAKLKEWTKQKPEWRKLIRINSSGCVDRCQEGIAIAVFPQNKWLVDVKLDNIEDVKNYLQHLLESDAPAKS